MWPTAQLERKLMQSACIAAQTGRSFASMPMLSQVEQRTLNA
jgi:hypothetical protein